MTAKLADQKIMDQWVTHMIDQQQVFGVQAKGERFAFGPLSKATELRLDYDVTILPPKKYLQPQQETLMAFKTDGTFTSVMPETEFILLGIHPYDMAAINQMDTIFSAGNKDQHYLKRRQNATMIVVDVETPSDDVFAGCMNTATVDKGFDILITKIDTQEYIVDARTEKGESLLAGLADAADADDKALKAREQVWEHNRKVLRKHEMKMKPEDLPALLKENYDHPVWAEKAARCYSCGSCNLVCPTCYCFDVQDDFNWDMETGERSRVWDGCMLRSFAEVAGDHNFRGKTADRFRHRYFRKGAYMPDTIGEVACIGCGRCGAACTAGIANPVELFNTLWEDKS